MAPAARGAHRANRSPQRSRPRNLLAFGRGARLRGRRPRRRLPVHHHRRRYIRTRTTAIAVTNVDGVPLWDFVRERDLQAIGYPISQRWVNGPFTFQAYQKVILQWDPGKQRMNYYNTLDVLANRYPEVELPNVAPHQVLEADRDADFATITRNHLALLDQNAAIKERFLSEPDWLNLYGLPISYEEREVNGHPRGLQMLRAQRTVFVIWNVPAPGVTVGRVNLQNVPDKVKRLSNVIIPDAAKVPIARDAVAGPPAPTTAPASDREVLVSLYHQTDGPNWTNNANWLSDAPLNDWHGVTADSTGRVTQLRLRNNQLQGAIPPTLEILANLAVLELNRNQLTGAVPPELSRLGNLERLWLESNQLSGTIPPELGNLAKLTWLDLGSNQLSGTIPPELGRLANLVVLELGWNQLSGEIPRELSRLLTLAHLSLTSNELRGAIPSELSLLAKLIHLHLGGNQLSGAIPPELGRLTNLEKLWLSASQLSGAIPPELGQALEPEIAAAGSGPTQWSNPTRAGEPLKP